MKYFITQLNVDKPTVFDKWTIFMYAFLLKKTITKIFRVFRSLVWHSVPKSLSLCENESYDFWLGIESRKTCACLDLWCGREARKSLYLCVQ